MLITTKVIIIGYRFDPYRSCTHNKSKTAEANILKFQRKVNQSKKVCHALNFGSHNPSSRSQSQVIVLFLTNRVSMIDDLTEFNKIL